MPDRVVSPTRPVVSGKRVEVTDVPVPEQWFCVGCGGICTHVYKRLLGGWAEVLCPHARKRVIGTALRPRKVTGTHKEIL
jgi:hypothetical protein